MGVELTGITIQELTVANSDLDGYIAVLRRKLDSGRLPPSLVPAHRRMLERLLARRAEIRSVSNLSSALP